MRITFGLIAIAIACTTSALSQGYSNGPFITHPGAYACAGGANGSALEPFLQYAGFNASVAAGARIADDFTVPAGQTWPLQSITVYAYQTNSPTGSTLNVANYRIWNGQPGAGGSMIHNLSSNQLISTSWTGVYREAIAFIGVCPTGTMRPVMRAVMGGNGIVLAAGTYWLDIQVGGTLASGPFVPPITILGTGATGNARQYTGTNWVAMTSNGYQQGMPFEIAVVPYPGSGEDLALTTLVNGTGGALTTKPAPAGSLLGVQLATPGGTFLGAIPVIAASFYLSTSPPAPNPGFPQVHLDLVNLLLLIDGTAPPPFFAAALTTSGVAVGLPVPAGLSGFTLRVQGAAFTPLAANGLFAATDAHEFVF